MAGFYTMTNTLNGPLTIGNTRFDAMQKRDIYLTDKDEADLAASRPILTRNTQAVGAYDVQGKWIVRDVDPNDNAADHDHAIAADAGSGLAAAATLQAAFVALSARVKALEDAAP